MGTLILPSAAANLAKTMARQQVADEEFQQGGRAFDVRQQLRDHVAPDLAPQSVEPLPPAIPETAANSLVAMPLVASTAGPSSPAAVAILLKPAAPGGPVAATTMLDDREAKKAAKREQKRLLMQKLRGGLKRKTVANREAQDRGDEDERRITHHQKELKRAQNKRYREKEKATKAKAKAKAAGNDDD